jgi:hypothetical protein
MPSSQMQWSCGWSQSSQVGRVANARPSFVGWRKLLGYLASGNVKRSTVDPEA